MILVLARDCDQGRVRFVYIARIIREIAPLAAMGVSEQADEIELDNGTVIMVKTSDFRSVRGLTVAAVICDEVAFGIYKASVLIPRSSGLKAGNGDDSRL